MQAFKDWYKNSGSAWSFSTEESKTNEQKFKVAWLAAVKWCEKVVRTTYYPDKILEKIEQELKGELNGKTSTGTV